jgi:PAS domain-containing protein
MVRSTPRARNPPKGWIASHPELAIRWNCDHPRRMLAAVLAGALFVVLLAAAIRLRGLDRELKALEAERVRLAAEGDALRAQLEERGRALDELTPYRGMVDATEDWVWAVDEHGTLTFSNPAGVALLGHADLVGRSLAELTHPDDQPVGWTGVLRRKHADGSWRTVDSRSVPAGDGWQGIDRDLSAPPQATATPGVAVVRSPVVDGRRDVVA